MKERKKDIANQIVKYKGLEMNLAHKYAVQTKADYTFEKDGNSITRLGFWNTQKTFKLRQSAIDYLKHQINWNFYKLSPNYSNIEHRIVSVEETPLFKLFREANHTKYE